MKLVKIFSKNVEKGEPIEHLLENDINDWLESNKNIGVIHISQSHTVTDKIHAIVTILYAKPEVYHVVDIYSKPEKEEKKVNNTEKKSSDKPMCYGEQEGNHITLHEIDIKDFESRFCNKYEKEEKE